MKKNVCPRCKVPKTGSIECENCGLVFSQHDKSATYDIPEAGLKKSASSTKKAFSSVIRIVGLIVIGFIALIVIIPLAAKFQQFNPFSKKISNISYFQIVDEIKQQKRDRKPTAAELDSIINQYIGKRVRWSGRVFEVKKMLSEYMVWVDMDKPGSGFSVQDVYIPIPKTQAKNYSKKQKITFVGNIKSIDSIMGKYTITLEGVSIQ